MSKFTLFCKILFPSLLLIFQLQSAAQTYTFTSAGASGPNGRTQSQINTAYAGTNLSGTVVSNSGVQIWTVPQSGVYRLTVTGAQGGGPNSKGGSGAQIAGIFSLTAGQSLKIVIGQKGETGIMNNGFNGGGGGGGSFIATSSNSLLIAAGGGGGGTESANGLSGQWYQWRISL